MIGRAAKDDPAEYAILIILLSTAFLQEISPGTDIFGAAG